MNEYIVRQLIALAAAEAKLALARENDSRYLDIAENDRDHIVGNIEHELRMIRGDSK